jgi:ABC-type transporter Mla maintaining outer membrane lipid asymmetry ATPase subunit MlaF
MLRFNAVTADGMDSPLTFTAAAGEAAAVITSRESENEAIIRVILGFQATLTGTFTLDDEQPAFLEEGHISGYRKKIGVIYHDGGFISNLNLWENLTLQIAFEGLHDKSEIESLGRSSLEKAGYSGSVSAPLSSLSLFQRRQVAFARALLFSPLLMIYHATFEGLSRSECKHLANLAMDYHNSGVIKSLFLTTYPETLRGMDIRLIYSTGGISQT